MKYKISDLIDIEEIQSLLDSFCDAVGIAAAIIDLKGKVLVGSRWQKICTDFHRVNERTCKKCIESDTQLANELQQGKRFSIYQCRNGLTDAASPIIIEAEHIANAFVGQFFLKTPDRGFFLRQSAKYDFEKVAYLDALSEVPIVKEENLPAILNFLTSFAEMVAIMGLDKLKKTKAGRALLESEERHRLFFENAPIGIFHYNHKGIVTAINDAMIDIFGSSRDKLIGFGLDDLPNKNFAKEVYKTLNGEHGYYEGKYTSSEVSHFLIRAAIASDTASFL